MQHMQHDSCAQGAQAPEVRYERRCCRKQEHGRTLRSSHIHLQAEADEWVTRTWGFNCQLKSEAEEKGLDWPTNFNLKCIYITCINCTNELWIAIVLDKDKGGINFTTPTGIENWQSQHDNVSRGLFHGMSVVCIARSFIYKEPLTTVSG
jgi:hypothetical protein